MKMAIFGVVFLFLPVSLTVQDHSVGWLAQDWAVMGEIKGSLEARPLPVEFPKKLGLGLSSTTAEPTPKVPTASPASGRAAGDASAEVAAAFAGAHAAPEPPGSPPFKIQERQEASRRAGRRLWLALAIAQHAAGFLDAWSTRRVIESGRGHELNPLLRPFVGSAALYPVMQVGPTLGDYLGHRMLHSPRRSIRRWWWLPQVVGTIGSAWFAAHNFRLANSSAPIRP